MARDLEALRAALRRRLVNGDRITGIVPLSAGHSNETYLVEGLDEILRMPPSGAPLIESVHGMRKQFHIYAVLARLSDALPVPAVRYLEQDPDVVGAPFFLMARVAGTNWGDWGAPEWARREGARW